MARPMVAILCAAGLAAAVFGASVVAEKQEKSGRASLFVAGRKFADFLEGKSSDIESLLPAGGQLTSHSIEELRALRASLRSGGGIMLTKVEIPSDSPDHGSTVYQIVRVVPGGQGARSPEPLAWRLEKPGHWVIDFKGS